MTVVRTVVLGIVLALGAGIAHRAFSSLVVASGAQAEPAVILGLLLAALLGILVAVATRLLRLPGAAAPTALVLGFVIVAGAGLPGVDAAVRLVPPAGLTAAQAMALVVACVAASLTLAVPADRLR